jgi:hypothetical protein
MLVLSSQLAVTDLVAPRPEAIVRQALPRAAARPHFDAKAIENEQ